MRMKFGLIVSFSVACLLSAQAVNLDTDSSQSDKTIWDNLVFEDDLGHSQASRNGDESAYVEADIRKAKKLDPVDPKDIPEHKREELRRLEEKNKLAASSFNAVPQA